MMAAGHEILIHLTHIERPTSSTPLQFSEQETTQPEEAPATHIAAIAEVLFTALTGNCRNNCDGEREREKRQRPRQRDRQRATKRERERSISGKQNP